MKLNEVNISYEDLDTSYLAKEEWEKRAVAGVLRAKRVGSVEEVLEGIPEEEKKTTRSIWNYGSQQEKESEEKEESKEEEEQQQKEEKKDEGYEEILLYYNGESDYIEIGKQIGGLMTDFKGNI